MKRPGEWSLLGYGSDPIDADDQQLNDKITYYKKVAQAITDEAAILHRIANGTDLVGKYADTMRKDAGDVAGDLDKVTGRYEAVVSALQTYEPALPPALSGSAAALSDAESAQADLTSARDTTAVPSSPDQTQAEAEADPTNPKNLAISQADDALSVARSRMRAVMAQLDDAGQAAARAIRASLNDGLKDSLADKIAHFFLKLIAIIVKILTYIAMALSAIALIIPGLGEAIFALGVAAFVGQAILTATGNGNGMDLLMAGVGILSFGAGKLLEGTISKGIEAGLKPAIDAASKAFPQDLVASIKSWDEVAGKVAGGGTLTPEEEVFNALPRPGVEIEGLAPNDLAAAGEAVEGGTPTTLAQAGKAGWGALSGQAGADGLEQAVASANAALKFVHGNPIGPITIKGIPALGILRGQGVFDSSQSWFGGIWGAVGDAGKTPDYSQFQPGGPYSDPDLSSIGTTFTSPWT